MNEIQDAVFHKLFMTYLLIVSLLDIYIFFSASDKVFKATIIVPLNFCIFITLAYTALAESELTSFEEYL